jgi:type I restriction enzyme R subunit
MTPREESEWKTRKRRIDPRLDAVGWKLGQGQTSPTPSRTEEHETQNGPADYVLWHDRNIVAVVEAKKVTIGPQNVLTQAERYARGLGGVAVQLRRAALPRSLYSTNGEVLWFHDVRHPQNRSRKVARFHTPNALRELLGRDFEAACEEASRSRMTIRGFGRIKGTPTKLSRKPSPSERGTCSSPWLPARARRLRS